ncbi:Flp pilus assembly protein CpaB [Paenisporosarcina sp. NPDC076898]|uniref:Flp pilus assembly protein CpaB n=1 Tax=unclassified Paenisporosarcina TaxID=2642018 RepID=UPI003D06805A
MTTKKVWLLAMVFGVIAAGLMYVVFMEKSDPVAKPTTSVNDKEKETEEVEKPDEEKKEEEVITVATGKRAMTVEVTDVQGVAGLIRPGSSVDVIAVMEAPEENVQESQHDSATMLLQNVNVLAVGHAADDEETMKRYQMVTLEVTPKEGLFLGFSSKYELYLMLRPDGDDQLQPEHTHVHENELHKGVFK